MMISETYDHPNFNQSLTRLFERDAEDSLRMGFNATTTLLCSPVRLQST